MPVGLIGRNNSRMTDKELALEVVQHGSHKAFAEIVHRYSGMIFSKALGVMHSEEGAAEVTQQTFVRAFERLDSWRGTELAPWLTAIATHRPEAPRQRTPTANSICG